jgi:hypothetical protein
VIGRSGGLLLLAGILGAAAGVGVAPLAAQQPPARAPAADTTRPAPGAPSDSAAKSPEAPGDTVAVPDSLSPDSFLPRLPPLGSPPGPMPQAARYVFDRDFLWFSGALTLGELLEHVPGAFLVRAGWFGRPEVIQYAGQGATSIEVFWDGFALDPLGGDSTGFDLSSINLGLLQRVEVEVLPSVLRVYLFSDDQAVRRPRTETAFATGDANTNTYRIRYLNRWKSGTGLGLGVNYLGSSGAVTSPGRSSDLTLWAKGSWVPTPQLGVDYQVVSVSLNRDTFAVAGPGGTVGAPRRRTHRTDVFVRGFVASRPDGMGLRFDALAGSSTFDDTLPGLARKELQGAGILSFRAAHWSGELTARLRDGSTPLELELRTAVSPVSPLTVSAYARRRTHLLARRSLDAGLQAEFRPWRALTLHGAVRVRDAVAAPAIATDTAQRVTDLVGGVTLQTRLADLDLSIARHGTYAAPVYGSFGDLGLAYPDLPVRTVTAAFALRPTPYLTVSGWYREPLDPVTSAYEPPHHSRLWAEFRTRLLPILRRGAFDFVAEFGMEGWSHGAVGIDSAGATIPLPGATVLDGRLELRLVNAAIYWTVRNMRGEHYDLVPGVLMPRVLQRYGVRWEFTN